MMIAEVNLGVVLVAALATMALGFLWYSPVLFGKPWMALMGKTDADMPEMKKKATKAYALSFIGALVMAYVLAHFVDYVGATTVSDGLQLGFWIWLGFAATIGYTDVLFGGKPFKLFLINTGYQLVELLLMGVILAVWS